MSSTIEDPQVHHEQISGEREEGMLALDPIGPDLPDLPEPPELSELAQDLLADPQQDAHLSRAERSRLTEQLLQLAHATTDRVESAALRERVVLLNRRVAEAVAARYRGRGVAQEDLDQAAYEGLTKAVDKFDPTLRNDLLTYAVPTIRGEIQRYFRDQSWMVRPPRRVQELQWRVNQTIDRMAQELGREPTDEEVRDELEISGDDYQEAMVGFGCFQPPSLDQPLADQSSLTLGDALPDDDDSDEVVEARTMLAPLVRRLSERDRRILYLRFFEDQTQQEIGENLGVTQMQVSRLLARILKDLRSEID